MALNVGELYAKLSLDSRGFNEGLDKGGRRFDSFGSNLERRAGRAAVGAGAALAGLAVKGVMEFAKLEKGMNEVFTLLPDISDRAMGDMTDQVRDFSKEFGTLPDEVVPALYQAISAGVPKDNVFDFLETAQQAALGGVTELTTAVDGISSVLNAYGSDAIDAATASDLMFTAVRLGKTDFDQLSRSLFNVIPTAAGVGVEFQDITAALAAMTAQGTPTSVATTQLRQVLVELSKEGTATSDTFKDLAGVGFREFIAQGGNLQGALQLMADDAASTGGSISDLFGSVEAGSAALSLTSESGAKAFGNAMGEMQDSAGATEQAFDQMDQGLGRTLDRLEARFNDVALEIGESLAPSIGGAGEMLINFADSSVPAVDAALEGLENNVGVVTVLMDELASVFGKSEGRGGDLARALILVREVLEDDSPTQAYITGMANLSETGEITEDQMRALASAAGLTSSEMDSANRTLLTLAEGSKEVADEHAGLVELYKDLQQGVPGAADRLADFGLVASGTERPIWVVQQRLQLLAQALRDTEFDTDNLIGSLEEAPGALQNANGELSIIAGGMPDYADATADAAGATDDLAGAQDDLAGETESATIKLREQFDLLRSQHDPLFNLQESFDKVEQAQADVTAAVEEFGEGTPEHAGAVSDLAEALLDMEDAELQVMEAGKLTRDEFVKQQTELGLTRDQAELLADSFEELNGFEFDPKKIIIDVGGTGKNFAHNFAGPGRQFGGRVAAGQLFEFGERDRPEIMQMGGRLFAMPGNAGSVLSNNDLRQFLSGVQGIDQIRSQAAAAMRMAAAGTSNSTVNYNSKQITLEGTGDPLVDAARVGAMDRVTEFMETA